ncbi:TetR/AcrR family transcriptional regulator [Nocardia puris]|uniref:TetR family transcriptional regulator n=1 Tax=Nocardia puris TaxID=208602 RepID=A0A366DUZ8_9NOCA|nr:TetR/AcrR family transcriptional regulator [Nocardia puris]MBF6210486.1 TetR/AcrR family transcriptional regulator [Nocardia puris]MBF6367561.1 TetR/AcrR family transcriptional regulator [Nocardia puris]MBF6457746.1 TetR/AcrR family transcriptional regulator [Nocardia puris]RBO93913.1 TetR family transcriptional regulator [Nocardia puris]
MSLSPSAESPPTGGRQARWQPHNDRRRERIVTALIELIEETPLGVEVPMQRITERAGLSKSVVYRQFSGRDDLDRRTRTAIGDQFTDDIDTALDISDGSIRAILHRTIGAVVDWIDRHARLYDFLRRGPALGDPDDVDAASSLKDRIAARTRQLVSGLAGVIGVVDEPVADTMTFAIVSMTEATVSRWARSPDRAMDRDTLVGELSAYAWSVIDGVARAHRLALDPDEPLLAVLSRLADADG